MLCTLEPAAGAAPPGKGAKPEGGRAKKRIDFAEQWVKRFMDVLDDNLDEQTKRQLMMANGKVCHREYLKSIGQRIQPIPFEQWAPLVKERVKDGSIRVEGRTIHFQFLSSAETGLPSAEGKCLCCLVETRPKGLSDTYCLCSLGYVQDIFEQTLGTKVEIELVDSVLRGGKRCKFKMTVAEDGKEKKTEPQTGEE